MGLAGPYGKAYNNRALHKLAYSKGSITMPIASRGLYTISRFGIDSAVVGLHIGLADRSRAEIL